MSLGRDAPSDRGRSDDADVPSVDGDLSSGGLGEQRPGHGARQGRYVPRVDLCTQNVARFVLGDAHAVVRRSLLEHFRGPQGGVIHLVRVQDVDSDACPPELQGCHPRQLCEARLRDRVGRGTRSGSRNVLRRDHDHRGFRAEAQEGYTRLP